METIIDEILGIEHSLEESFNTVKHISNNFSTTNKQSELMLNSIRKKIKNDDELMKKKRNSYHLAFKRRSSVFTGNMGLGTTNIN